MIYLDNNATTRPAPEVVAAMLPYLDDLYANPSSAHRAGMAVKPYQIFQHRTISALAAVLSTGSSDGNPDSGEPDVPLVSDEHLKLAFGLVRFDQD
mgnify:CR=1 FL=1